MAMLGLTSLFSRKTLDPPSRSDLRKTDPQTALTQDQRLAIEFRAR
jgi:hypothetical protein